MKDLTKQNCSSSGKKHLFRKGIATMEVVMLVGIAALLVTGIAYMMKIVSNDTMSKILDVIGIKL